jgi:hypothetical protein
MLERNRFVVSRRPPAPAAAYDVFDADTGEAVGTAEEHVGGVVAALRRVVNPLLMPTRIEVREKPDDSLVFSVRRRGYLFRTRVEVVDAQDEMVGHFRGKLLAATGGFHIRDRNNRRFAEVHGKWLGADYRLVTPDGSLELGRVTKTSNAYAVEVAAELTEQPLAKMLVLAAVLAIDTTDHAPRA